MTLAKQKRNLIIIAVIILAIGIVLSSFVYLNSQKPYAGRVEAFPIRASTQKHMPLYTSPKINISLNQMA